MKFNPNLTVPEILAIAIRAEINAQAIYLAMSEKITNTVVKEKFVHLSQQEKKHEEILTANKAWSFYGGTSPVRERNHSGISLIFMNLQVRYAVLRSIGF